MRLCSLAITPLAQVIQRRILARSPGNDAEGADDDMVRIC